MEKADFIFNLIEGQYNFEVRFRCFGFFSIFGSSPGIIRAQAGPFLQTDDFCYVFNITPSKTVVKVGEIVNFYVEGYSSSLSCIGCDIQVFEVNEIPFSGTSIYYGTDGTANFSLSFLSEGLMELLFVAGGKFSKIQNIEVAVLVSDMFLFLKFNANEVFFI